MWLSIIVKDVNALHAELRSQGANIVREPVDEAWGLREFHVRDPDGHTFRFGQPVAPAKDLSIRRTVVDARLEERLALVLTDLAKRTSRSVGEVLEEALLHSFEPVPGQEGQAVASPHARDTFPLIEALKREHGLDYTAHDAYRFAERAEGG